MSDSKKTAIQQESRADFETPPMTEVSHARPKMVTGTFKLLVVADEAAFK